MLFTINIISAWISFLVGILSGAFIGLFFHKETWIGGYSSFSRRLLRLGHIACFGIGFINLSFAYTASQFQQSYWFEYASSFALLSYTMILVCFLTAWKHAFRHIFFIPVLSFSGVVIFTLMGIFS